MMNIRSSLALKTGAVILSVVLITSLFFSLLVVGAFSMLGAYTDPDNFLDDIREEIIRIETQYVYDYLYGMYYDNKNIESEQELPELLLADNTNLRFIVTDQDNNRILSNVKELSEDVYSYPITIETYRIEHKESRTFHSRDEADSFYNEINAPSTQITSSVWNTTTDENGETLHTLTLTWFEFTYVDLLLSYTYAESATVKDGSYLAMQCLDVLFNIRWELLIIVAAMLVLLIVLFVFLCWTAGYKDGKDEPLCGFIDRIPFDLYFLLFIGIVLLILLFSFWFFDSIYIWEMPFFFLLVVMLCVLVLSLISVLFILSFATRIKCRTLFKNTLIRRMFSFIGFYLKNLPLYWKTGIAIAVMLSFEFFFMLFLWSEGDLSEFIIFCWFAGNMILIPTAVYFIIQFKKLHIGAKKIAEGDSSYRVDTNNMILELKEHGQTLNSIRDGLQKAVDEQMKSERFKTELITNVSHDIKTPLTSIINYVDLLKKEDVNSEKVNEYIDVLDRQSTRLKKLIEDLIEASKASTGNISINLESIDLHLLVAQTVAEFQDKLDAKGLVAVTNLTANDKCMVKADGRLLWRVFENLMGNVCKYAQEGTRVYISTEALNNRVKVTVKNTSKYQLNISGKELMERFTRGDASRHTEGSGLGLSIADSLITLQNGSFQIKIDGDLFKVIFDLPSE